MPVSLSIAFGAGLISFFAPCVIPLLPAYVAYVTGVSLEELGKHGYKPFRRKIIISSVFYILGFSLVFVLLGTAAAGIGVYFRRYDRIIQIVGGLLILVFGLEFAGFLNIPFFAREKKFQLPKWTEKLGNLRAFFVGIIFASAWTPCVGVVLGSILTLAAISGTAAQGALLLFVYSLGISLPFLAVSFTLASVPKYVSVIRKRIGVISKVAGIILAILGLLLLTNTYRYLNSFLFGIAFRWGYIIK